MKKKVFKNIMKALAVIFIVLGLYAYISIIFIPKDMNDRGGYQYSIVTAIEREKQNSLDIIMYGNSDLSSAIIPMEVYKETGITSFLNWGDQQSVSTILSQLKHDLKKQKPKMVVIEVDCLYYPNKYDTFTRNYGNPFIIPFIYHTRWKQIELKDFYTLPSFSADQMKGYMYITLNGNYKYEDYMGSSTAIEPMDDSVVRDVKEIKSICDHNDIDLLFIEAPSPSSWNMERHNGVQALADELEVSFIDYNFDLENFPFDYNNHFRDYGNHCNYYGAKLITSYFNDYLKENYEYENRRQNPEYSSWEECLKNYEKRVNGN